MNKIPINREVLVTRLEEIRKDIQELETFKTIPLEKFKKGRNFPVAEHYLRRALEAIFDIGTHILSRVPGARTTTYKEIANLLGKFEIVPEDFAQNKLVKMAGYRNRLVHFYLEIKENELYQIIQKDLPDIEEFCTYIKRVLLKPQEFNLTIE
ncbi:MAG TPA: DUF86 domain-containing protein [Candidatus Omnitrophica bacterium]|nr:DUF86 domain-containing protein [Candidatus Omnitrophota bacterium]